LNVLRERPRVTLALVVALVAVVGLAMLAGAALAGGEDCPTADVAGMQAQTQR
jgi:hypothetical protein